MYIDFIDLPPVPEELIEPYDTILAKPALGVGDHQGKIIPIVSIQRREVRVELVNWLQSICNFPVVAQYLLLNSSSPLHKDPPDRPQSYNYIIYTGGPNVTTTVYRDDYSTSKSMVIPARQWHCLDTGKPHRVHGIQKNNWRIVLTINYNSGAPGW